MHDLARPKPGTSVAAKTDHFGQSQPERCQPAGLQQVATGPATAGALRLSRQMKHRRCAPGRPIIEREFDLWTTCNILSSKQAVREAGLWIPLVPTRRLGNAQSQISAS